MDGASKVSNLSLQFLGPINYKAEIPESRLFFPQTGVAMQMIELRRNDKRSFNVLVKDNFARVVNLQGASIKFVLRSRDAILGPDGERVIVATQEAVTIYDQLSYEHIGQFNVVLGEDATETAGQYRAEFQVQLKGIAQNRKTPEYALADDQTLVLLVDGEEQTITFDSNDFVDISNATAAEVVAAINAQITGAIAYVVRANICDSYILIHSTSENGSIQAHSGSAIDALGFNTLLQRDQTVSLPDETLIVNIKEDLDEQEVID